MDIPNGILYIGRQAFVYCYSLTTVTIPNSVVSIGESAFDECTKLTSVTLGSGITSIGTYAFRNCSLTSIDIPNGLTSLEKGVFYRCNDLTSVIIPNSITSIGESAFSGCSGLTSVTIGSSVTSIGMGAFVGCSSLTSITIPNSVISIGDYAFYMCSNLTTVTIPNNVTEIGGSAFGFCTSLISITIPNSVSTIGNDAFSGCSSLTSVTIGGNVSYIGTEIFKDCSSITSIIWNSKSCSSPTYNSDAPFFRIRKQITSFVFGNEVEYIPSYLCYGMEKLTNIEIPNSVLSIDKYAFSSCSGLTSIAIPNSVTSIGEYAFQYCSSLTTLSIGNGLINMNDWAFSSCPNLTYVTAPAILFNSGISTNNLQNIVVTNGELNEKGFTNINNSHKVLHFIDMSESTTAILPDQGLKDCFNLEQLYLPSHLTQIGYEGLYGCYALQEITLPETVNKIGNKAFTECSNLNLVNSKAIVPPSIGNIAFDNRTLTTATLRVPCGSRNTYTASAWGNYFSVIEEDYVYNVSITANDDSMGEVTFDLDCNNNQASITATANDGYRFVQWSDGNANTNRIVVITQDTALIAQFEAIPLTEEFAVYFLNWDGTLLSEQMVEKGNAAITPIDPVREGYHFIGWSADINTITERTFAIACYEKEFDGVPVYFVGADSRTLLLSYIADTIPETPFLEDKVFIGWTVLEGNLADGVIIRATYEEDKNTGLPPVSISETPQKLLQNGHIIIKRADHTYTLTGQEIQ